MGMHVTATPNPSSEVMTLKSFGYDLNTAIGDIVDNSIAANSSNVKIYFYVDRDIPRFAIIDDGCGMSKTDLIDNMSIGCKNPTDQRKGEDLGRFGSGLKTASFSQADRLIVLSKSGGRELSGCVWDLNKIIESNEWLLEILDKSEIDEIKESSFLKNTDSGTVVIWENLRGFPSEGVEYTQHLVANKCEALAAYAGKTFHRFLSGKRKLALELNGEKIEPIDPFVTNLAGYQEGPEEIFRTQYGKERSVIVKCHLLPLLTNWPEDVLKTHGGGKKISDEQGLYIYRNRRLISGGGWHGILSKSELYNLSRVQIDFPSELDFMWNTDVKKSKIEIPSKIKEKLKSILRSPTKRSKIRHLHKGKISADTVYWNVIEKEKKVSYQINLESEEIVGTLRKLDKSLQKEILKFFVGVQNNIPFYHIYQRLSGSPKSIENELDEKQELRELLRRIEARND